MESHQNQSNPAPIREGKIVEAFGLRKCPKLVEQVAGSSLEVRINALGVLCEEFKNPYSIQGCCAAGIVRVLSAMVSDPDFTTRERASQALAIAAQDANGLSSILVDDTGTGTRQAVVEILNGIKDPSQVVRGNVYECLYHISRTPDGVASCVIAGVVFSFVNSLMKEDDALKPRLLQTIRNILANPEGLEQTLSAGTVRRLLLLLKSEHTETCANAARTLGFLCFEESAKNDALTGGAMGLLVSLIDANKAKDVKNGAVMAMMALSSTDEGRRQMLDPASISKLSALLYEDDKNTKLRYIHTHIHSHKRTQTHMPQFLHTQTHTHTHTAH